ncbi:hypothetical protein IEO21_10922 [Rhodonia placenta]|uniref:Uncharacterized protein n=1 Tax=Rhodonia placenta TaxID=104341 RepID=A0A8H7NRL6_9APHY|nr:hypothetical protein IEO21_10922 [Postia placenta]
MFHHGESSTNAEIEGTNSAI